MDGIAKKKTGRCGRTIIPCPSEGCEIVLEYNEIKHNSSKDSFEKSVVHVVAKVDVRYTDLLSRSLYEADPCFRYCADEKCEAGQFVEEGTSNRCLTLRSQR
jgi:hypothetical protein